MGSRSANYSSSKWMEQCQFLLQAKKVVISLLLTPYDSLFHALVFYILTQQLSVSLQDQNSVHSVPQPTELDVFLPQDGSNLTDGVHSGKWVSSYCNIASWVRNIIHTCSRHGVATAVLPSERPGNKTFCNKFYSLCSTFRSSVTVDVFKTEIKPLVVRAKGF